jgi:hypothetical protein
MNPNDLVAQQQALLNQYMQNAQHAQYGLLALGLAWFIISGLVLYAFYARLRGIEDEIRKFRIAYEFANPPSKKRPPGSTGTESPENPFA